MNSRPVAAGRPDAVAAAASVRVFFALWPPPDCAEALHRAARDSVRDGRLMRAETLHMTLAFIGAVAPARLADLIAAGTQAVAGHAPFELVIDRLAYWRHNQIVWAGCDAAPGPLDALAADLRAAVRRAGLPVAGPAFKAHVTLARKAAGYKKLAPTELPLRWPVKECCLMASETTTNGARYTLIHAFSLIA